MGVKRKCALVYLASAALVVIADAWSKGVMEELLVGRSTIDLLPFLHLVLIHNQGAAFGFLATASGWQNLFFIVIATIISLLILIRIIRVASGEKWSEIALVFILGGAIGNLVDRIRLGYVVDFIGLHYRSWQFPAFNLADVAITIGAMMLLLDLLRILPRRKMKR